MPTIAELKEECKRKGISGYSKKTKAELEKLCGGKSPKKTSPKKPSSKKTSPKKPSSKKSSPKKPSSKGCPPGKIRNPKTQNCVDEKGKVGKQILKEMEKE